MRTWCTFQYPPQHPQRVGPNLKEERQARKCLWRKRCQKVGKMYSRPFWYLTMISDLLVLLDFTKSNRHGIPFADKLPSWLRIFTMSSLSNCEVHFIVEMNQQFVKSIFCPNCQIYITKSTLPSCRHQVGQVADNMALPTHQVHIAKLPTTWHCQRTKPAASCGLHKCASSCPIFKSNLCTAWKLFIFCPDFRP